MNRRNGHERMTMARLSQRVEKMGAALSARETQIYALNRALQHESGGDCGRGGGMWMRIKHRIRSCHYTISR